VPRPLPLGLGVFGALSIYQMRTESWAGMIFGISWLALIAVLLSWFARQRQWGPRHQLALVAVALGLRMARIRADSVRRVRRPGPLGREHRIREKSGFAALGHIDSPERVT
jgi:hypothetical protein